jgi:hypothetical protein
MLLTNFVTFNPISGTQELDLTPQHKMLLQVCAPANTLLPPLS